ncbi:MAG TPA: DUF362 domain-containing protein [Spirochaetota bacterium]|nr:DUF362 domain-containing protein [Spirochaetota bacterium]
MASEVFFSSLDCKKFKSPLEKFKRLVERCEIDNKFSKDELIAIKVHFGELGNTAFIRPIYLRPIIDKLKSMGCKPYLTDTNTLYIGMRGNSVDHLHNANSNGFNYSTLQVPVIIADGLRGENTVEVDVNLPLCKKVKLASDIINADGMVCVSHFKAHEVSGFGGAIKNLSMGCGSRQGKLDMHSNTRPYVEKKGCISCNKCITSCQVRAIEMQDKAFITERCVGCARCIAVCPTRAINVKWNESSDNTQKKMVEYAYGTVKSLGGRIVYVNVLTSISNACDCYAGNDKPMTPDIGFLSSLDPIALDKASYDLVVNANNGVDPFKSVYPNINTLGQFEHSKTIGFGNTEYTLINVE